MNKPSFSWTIMIFWTLCVITLGAYTRLSDAGLGCPDWPTCYGQWFLEANAASDLSHSDWIKGWIEMIHRYLAGSLGLFVFFITYQAWVRQEIQFKTVMIFWGLIIFQALLGMWTVTLKLNPIIVSAHLLGGLLLLIGAVICNTTPESRTSAQQKNLILIRWVCVIYTLQILLGAWVSTNYAGLSCANPWTCQPMHWSGLLDASKNLFTPDSNPLLIYSTTQKALIQFIHRINAIILGYALFYTRHCFWKTNDPLRATLDAACLLYIVQLMIGILLVALYLPFTIALMHNIFAALLAIPIMSAIASFYGSSKISIQSK
ncbi:MAG: heme A synthase [Gammaproteobacteria bacterium]|nr:heme A synthase [Gammaproteobacteria bacterium]